MRTATLALLALAACARPAPEPATARTHTVVIAGTGVHFELVALPDASGKAIGRTEVTWDEYQLFCNWDGPPDGVDGVARPSRPLETFPYDRRWGLGRRPAVGMSGQAAARYCEWLSQRTGLRFRLPSEAEWEAACGRPAEHGGASAGAEVEPDAVAWHAGNAGGRTQEVGSKAANVLGIHDLLGNLWEYVGDGSVLRGGSWQDLPEALSPSARLLFDENWTLRDSNFPPGVWWVPDGDHLGFRVLCEDLGR